MFNENEVKYHGAKSKSTKDSNNVKMEHLNVIKEAPTCIWLKYINPQTTASQIKRKLSKYGAVLSAKIITNGYKYHAKALMEKPHHAQLCIDKFHLTKFKRYLIEVSLEEPYKPKNKSSEEKSRFKSPRKHSHDTDIYKSRSTSKRLGYREEKDRLYYKVDTQHKTKKRKPDAEMYEFQREKKRKHQEKEERCYCKEYDYEIQGEEKIKYRRNHSRHTRQEDSLKSKSILNSEKNRHHPSSPVICSKEHSFNEDDLYSIKDIKCPPPPPKRRRSKLHTNEYFDCTYEREYKDFEMYLKQKRYENKENYH